MVRLTTTDKVLILGLVVGLIIAGKQLAVNAAVNKTGLVVGFDA